MNVTITARHFVIPERVRRRALDRVQRLRRYDPRILAADVAFVRERATYIAEARLEIAGEPAAFARAKAADPGAALDRMIERLRRQLKRERERARDHRAAPLYEILTPAGH